MLSQKKRKIIFRHSISHIFIFACIFGLIAGFFVIVQAQTFRGPDTSAPNNALAPTGLNQLSSLSWFLKVNQAANQDLQGPLIVGDVTKNPSSQAQALIGIDSTQAALVGVGGATVPAALGFPVPVYGYANAASESYGIYGYATGPGSAGVFGRTGSQTGYAASFIGKVLNTDGLGGQLDTSWTVPPVAGSLLFQATNIDGLRQFAYIGGTTESGAWRIEKRHLADGSFDTEFDGNVGNVGYVDNAIASPASRLNDLLYDGGDHVYTIGTDGTNWRLEKRWSLDGRLVISHGFGGATGIITENYVSAIPKAMAEDRDNLYVAGIGNSGWLIEKRERGNGFKVAAFDSDGVVASSGNALDAIAVDTLRPVLYVAGKDGANWKIEKYSSASGVLCTGVTNPCGLGENFGIGGAVTVANRRAMDIAYDQDRRFLYVVGHRDEAGQTPQWRIEKRLATTGALCWSDVCGATENFGNDGSLDLIANTKEAYGIALDTGYLYIAGTDSVTGWRVEKRRATDGALDTTFGVSGAVRSEAGSSIAYAIDAFDNSLVIVGDDVATDGRIEHRFSGPNSADIYVQDRTYASVMEAASRYYHTPAVVGLNSVSISGTPTLALDASSTWGAGLYGMSEGNQSNVYGVRGELSITNSAIANTTVYGIRTESLGGKKGAFGFAYGTNAVEGRVDASSVLHAVEGKTNGTTIEEFGITGEGTAFDAYFDGDIVVDAGNELRIGPSGITEEWIRRVLLWCGSSCSE